MFKKLYLILVSYFFLTTSVDAQLKPIGEWQNYFSFNSAKTVALANNNVFGGKLSLYNYDLKNNTYNYFSKINKLNDLNIRKIKYN
nr:hypothetical protein [Chitinophagaceae bacterium]